jgi:putative transposase
MREEAMKKSRFTDEQIVRILREADKESVADVAKRHAVSEQTIYVWRRRFGEMASSDVKRLKDLEQENARLRKLLVQRDLEIDVMKEIAGKNGERAGPQAAGRLRHRAWGLAAQSLHADPGVAIDAGLRAPHSRKGCRARPAHEGAERSVPEVWLPSDSYLPGAGRVRDERLQGLEAMGLATVAAPQETAPQARGHWQAAAARTDEGQPGLVIRLRLRCMRQRPAAQVPDADLRVHEGGAGH